MKLRSGFVTGLGMATRLAAGYSAMRRKISRSSRPRLGKRRYGSRYGTSKRRRRETPVSLAAYTRVSYRRGRKPRRTLRRAFKEIRDQTEKRIYAFRQYTDFGGTNGSLYLKNIVTALGPPPTGPNELPVHLYEVTSQANTVNGTLVTPNIGWFPTLTDVTGTSTTITWNNSFPFAIETTPRITTAVDNAPHFKDRLDWVQAKFMFYCPTTKPTRIQIDLCQLKDTRLVPTTGTVDQFHVAFWQAMAKKFVKNPLESNSTDMTKWLKIIDSKSFILEPKETTEVQNTNMREVNLFYRMNRLCRYNWNQNDIVNMGTNDQPVNAANNSVQVHPRARIFLMIRGISGFATAQTSTLHPSYDIILRKSHSQFNS